VAPPPDFAGADLFSPVSAAAAPLLLVDTILARLMNRHFSRIDDDEIHDCYPTG
jgi:hypothetical protein